MPLADKQISKIKMVVLTKNGSKNVVWYSPLKYQRKPEQLIIIGMYTRFLERPEAANAQVIQFYTNHSGESGQLIEEFKIKH